MKNVRHILLLVAGSGLIAAIGFTHGKVCELLRRETLSVPQNIVPTADAVRLCSLGYDQLVADWCWLSFIQYVGDGEARARDHYCEADKYLELVVGLDPGFVSAYWFAAFVIGSDARQPKVAAEFIDRGIRSNPNNWSLPFIAGVNQYLYAKNDVMAAKYYRMAAKFPDAPKWLSRQADILQARIPTFIKQIRTWDNIYRSSDDSLVKEKARINLVALWHRVLDSATTDVIKNKARAALKELEPDE